MDLRTHCLRILESGALDDKRRAPRDQAGRLLDDPPWPPIILTEPARDRELRLVSGGGRLPKLTALGEVSARQACLERFAHHELQAIELFAWALLAFPDAPAPLRRGWVSALEDEQLHLGLYLDRLSTFGGTLGDRPLSGYLWSHVPRIVEADNPLCAFLCVVGLTYEQANLDFTLLYRDGFAAAGDSETAEILQRVHDDEIRHVGLAVRWLRRIDPDRDDVDAYDSHVPFPLGAARAKGRNFSAEPRRRAGMSPEFVDHVAAAAPHHVRDRP